MKENVHLIDRFSIVKALFSKGNVVPRRWGSGTLRFGIKQVDEGQIMATVKGFGSRRFDRQSK